MTEFSRRTVLAMTGGALACYATRRAVAHGVDHPFADARGYAHAIADKKLSAAEAVNSAIARIEKLDRHLNAVVARDFERARADAAEADRAIARGERRPLLGVPMTVKEVFNIKGLPTTLGDPAKKAKIAEKDSDDVVRLRNAGAIILGKTNMPLNLGDWQSYNAVYGTTNNPWNLDRTPGGSSGGSAAALAAGYVPLELGSDFGGSIRVPAVFCGVYGHKTSAEGTPGTGSMAVTGPMARSAADLALTLDILNAPVAGGAERPPFAPARHKRLKDYRVLVLDRHPLAPTSRDIVDALARRADLLEKQGVRVERSRPLLAELEALGRADIIIRSRIFQKYTRSRYFAGEVTDEVHAAAQQQRPILAAKWQELFKEFDVILCPTMPTVAFPHNQSEPLHERTLKVDDQIMPYVDQIMWNALCNFTGLPGTAAPLELNREGLPVGIQIVGPFREDRTSIAFAELMEEAFGGFKRPPLHWAM